MSVRIVRVGVELCINSGTYDLITACLGVVWDVTYCVLAPHKQVVVVGLEETVHKLCPSFKSL